MDGAVVGKLCFLVIYLGQIQLMEVTTGPFQARFLPLQNLLRVAQGFIMMRSWYKMATCWGSLSLACMQKYNFRQLASLLLLF